MGDEYSIFLVRPANQQGYRSKVKVKGNESPLKMGPKRKLGSNFSKAPKDAVLQREKAGPAIRAKRLERLTGAKKEQNAVLNVDLVQLPVVTRKIDLKLFSDLITLKGTKKLKMGSTQNMDEQPVRTLRISSFKISRDPVTNAQYEVYLEETGRPVTEEVADLQKKDHPVIYVNWFDAIKFCNWLSRKKGRPEVYEIRSDGNVIWNREKKGVRLPTEAEREYAARGEEGREYPFGNEFDESKVVSSVKNDREGTEPVDSPANKRGATPEGIRGLAGNVWEWCWDWYNDYKPEDLTDPIGPEKGSYRVLRGGSWFINLQSYFRSALRRFNPPEIRLVVVGFRFVEDLF